MPLDATDHSFYVIHYYLKHIHKPLNSVFVCFVSDDFLHGKKTDEEEEVVKKDCCKCIRKKGVDVGPSPGVLAELRKKDRYNCMLTKHRVKHLFNKNEVRWGFHRLRGADVGATILEYAQKMHGDMIVLGHRNLSGLKRTIYGSVSDKVLHHSPVPVLVVRKPEGAMSSETTDRKT